MILYSELCEKDVIDIKTGSNLGTICDLEIDEHCARITAIIVCEKLNIFCFFMKTQKYLIKWKCIKNIGEDVILVDANDEKVLCNQEKVKFLSKIFN